MNGSPRVRVILLQMLDRQDGGFPVRSFCCSNGNFIECLEIPLEGVANIGLCFRDCVSFRYASWKGGDIGRVSAFLLWFENYINRHKESVAGICIGVRNG